MIKEELSLSDKKEIMLECLWVAHTLGSEEVLELYRKVIEELEE